MKIIHIFQQEDLLKGKLSTLAERNARFGPPGCLARCQGRVAFNYVKKVGQVSKLLYTYPTKQILIQRGLKTIFNH